MRSQTQGREGTGAKAEFEAAWKAEYQANPEFRRWTAAQQVDHLRRDHPDAYGVKIATLEYYAIEFTKKGNGEAYDNVIVGT